MSGSIQASCFSSLRLPSLRRSRTRASPILPQLSLTAAQDLPLAPSELYSIAGPEKPPPAYSSHGPTFGQKKPAFMDTVNAELDRLDPALRDLSLQIHDNPELMFKEKFAHDLLTEFMASRGFHVTRHYLGLETAWRAEFRRGTGGRVVGVNAEMDALPGIGHACGHNLIAMSGVGVALAVRAALVAHGIDGAVVLLGTPAEEGGSGKAILLDRGAYEDMDVCVMSHPTAGAEHSVDIKSSLAMQPIEIEYFGHPAHAAAAPWEGTNALDAAFLAYSAVAVLRQQIKPTHRVHGIVQGSRDWVPNVIPDYAKMVWMLRAPTKSELGALSARIQACLKASAMATACEYKMSPGIMMYDLRQNCAMGDVFSSVMEEWYGAPTVPMEVMASTDFGNVTYALPSFHPTFAIPTEPNGANHTRAFARAARTPAAHAAALAATKGLALAALRAAADDAFFAQVRRAFEEDRERRQS